MIDLRHLILVLVVTLLGLIRLSNGQANICGQEEYCNQCKGKPVSNIKIEQCCSKTQELNRERFNFWTEPKDNLVFGIRLSKGTFAQEGRSFCLVGEHIRGTELANSETLKGFKDLWLQNLDIGNHIRPDDSTKMNIMKQKYFDHERAVIDDIGIVSRPNQSERCDFRPAIYEEQPQEEACLNPYKIEVTEIHAHRARLHNYLHIKVFADTVSQPQGKKCPTGKMKYIMLEVRDSVGLPVGHFTDEVPCDMDNKDSVRQGPNGIEGFRIIGTRKNHMPCMFSPKRAVSHPGIFLATNIGMDKPIPDGSGGPDPETGGGDGGPDPETGGGDGGTESTKKVNMELEYFTEVHATWRFAQLSSNFIPELHFAALIVEDPTPLRYFTGRRLKWERSNCQFREDFKVFQWRYYHDIAAKWMCYISAVNNIRPYGYIAQYSKLTLSEETMGGWDYYRRDFIVPKHVDCHVQLSRRYYRREEGNSQLTAWMDILEQNFNMPDSFVGRNFIFANAHFMGNNQANSRINFYKNHIENDPSRLTTKYSRITDVQLAGSSEEPQPLTTYFGTKYTQMAYNPSIKEYGPTYENTIDPAIKTNLNRLRNIQEQAKPERCPCPALPSTLRPDRQPKPALELDGRRLHAIQMFMAWVVLIPIGMFIARYFKETYSRVFFMQEYWWYSIHVLTLITAFIFMLGGIYIVRLNRNSTALWGTGTYFHVGFGYMVIFVYGCHCILGFFRVWTAYWRIVQIMMHWFFGVMEYVFAVATIFFAAVIIQGYLNCDVFNIYMAFLIIQVLFYVVMDIHLRIVDYKLALKPPRSYLPPPVMRIFHTDAPYSKFRIMMLVFFSLTCVTFYAAIHISLSDDGELVVSCYEHEVEMLTEVEI